MNWRELFAANSLLRSPKEAKAWIQNSTFPETEKARLLALPPGFAASSR